GSVMKLGKSDRSMDVETVSTGSLGLDIPSLSQTGARSRPAVRTGSQRQGCPLRHRRCAGA
ncbi:MAG: hypothetical protein E6471_19265, partial [Bradyrhizobium sp.]|nr:hypothetical protein [Bradyrhizobium sp.]